MSVCLCINVTYILLMMLSCGHFEFKMCFIVFFVASLE